MCVVDRWKEREDSRNIATFKKQTLFLDQKGNVDLFTTSFPLTPWVGLPTQHPGYPHPPLYSNNPNKHTYKNTTVCACVFVCFTGLFVYTLQHLYKYRGWPGFSHRLMKVLCFLKRGTGFKPQAPIKEKPQPPWLRSQIPHPEVTHCLTSTPKAVPDLKQG